MKIKKFNEEKEYNEGQRVLIAYLNQVFGNYIKVELFDFDYDIVGYDLSYQRDNIWNVYYIGIKAFSLVEDDKFTDLNEIFHKDKLVDLIVRNMTIISAEIKEKIKNDDLI